ncbi:MAG: tetratricopeptide repeat protein [Pseudomonadota bacterium]
MAWWIGSCLYNNSPRLNFILIKKDDQHLRLLNGETLHLHPRDRLRILKISTNICLNRGVRLLSRGFDVSALLYEETPLSTLLPDKEIFNRYKFRVEIKQYNHNLGSLEMVIEPHVEDWLDKAQRTIDLSQRIAILERALDLSANDERIRTKLIEEYKSARRWSQATQLLEKEVKDRPDQKELSDLLEAYEAMADTGGMISALKRLIEKEPDNADLRLQLASTLEKSKKLQEAINEYESLLELLKKEDSLPVYKTLGYLYVETNQIEKAIAKYLQAVEMDKNDANLFYNLSTLYERIGKKDQANLYLEKAVGLKSEDMEGRLKLAEGLIKGSNIIEAERHLKEVLRKNPDSIEALLLMIKVAEKKGDKDALKGIYKKILSHDPKNETIIHNLGVLEYETGLPSESLPYFEKLVKLHPNDIKIHEFLFNLYKKLKKDDLASKEAEILIKLNPKEMGYYHYLFEYLDKRGHYDQMIDIIKKGLISNPKNMDLGEYLVLVYLKTGKENLALEQMMEILKVKPKDLTTLLQLARLQDRQGKLEEAARSYKKILDISPGNEEAKEAYLRVLLGYAKLKEKEGKAKEALKYYKKVLEIFPGHAEAEEAYLRLRLEGLTGGEKD